MIKKIAFSSFASVLLLSQVANAEIKIGKGALTFNAGVSSQYIWRGVDQNKDKASPFVGADFSHPVGDFNLYLGVWTGAQDNIAGAGGQEIDYYAGLTKSFGPATFDIGYSIFVYPGADTKDTKETAEYYGKLTIAPDKQPYTFGLAYYVDDTGGYKYTGLRQDFGGNYYEINASYNFGPAQGLVSYGVYENETNTTTVSVSKEIIGVAFTLSYINAERDSTSSVALNKDRDYVTLSAKKVF
jgi:uncharacterized protein (TIGR02001 family)